MSPTHNLETHTEPWTNLRPHPNNPRMGDTEAITESVLANGVYRPIVVARDNTILAGHHLYEALGSLGRETVSVIRLDLDPGSVEAHRIMVADNRTSDRGGYDEAQLLALLNEFDDLTGTGYDDRDLADLTRIIDNDPEPLDPNYLKYTQNVDPLTYEPTMEVPPPPEGLYDPDKCDEILARIDATPEIPDPMRAFLQAAATRHIVFDYQQIAEAYCHTTPEIQRLFEDSALVIIDLHSAIRNGYTKLEAFVEERAGEATLDDLEGAES